MELESSLLCLQSPPRVRILSKMHPIHNIQSCFFLRCILILSSHLRPGLPTGLFSSDFPTKILYAFITSLVHAACLVPSHRTRPDHSNNIWCSVQVLKLLIMQSSVAFRHLFSPSSRFYPQKLILKHIFIYG